MTNQDKLISKTCLTIMQHYKNLIDADCGGFHTRLFSHILHPETKFICIGESVLINSETKVHLEHVVPCAVLISETKRLIKENKLSDDEIAGLLKKHWKVAIITNDEAKKLDFTLKLKSVMPKDWCFEHGKTNARLNLAKIELRS